MNQKTWKLGKEAELAFWQVWLKGRGSLYEKENRLKDIFTPMIGAKKELKIANLGAGPLNLIGDRRRDVKVKVFASDALANEYKKILKKLEIKPANPVKYQDMAKLTYKNGFFDIVFCSNALDHCKSPYEALKEIVRVCKPGGWIFLRHIAHEGQRHHYRGLHQWNIDATEDGDSIIWNGKPGTKTDTFLLSEIYPGFKTTWGRIKGGALVTSIVQKNG